MIASTLTRYQGPEAEPILDCVRLQLIGMKDLLNEVRPLKLASADSIMDAISMKVEFYKKSCRIIEFCLYDNLVSIKKFRWNRVTLNCPIVALFFQIETLPLLPKGLRLLRANSLITSSTETLLIILMKKDFRGILLARLLIL